MQSWRSGLWQPVQVWSKAGHFCSFSMFCRGSGRGRWGGEGTQGEEGEMGADRSRGLALAKQGQVAALERACSW